MPDIDRIKRNVGRMIDQGAPDGEIEAYLADEGVTEADLVGKGVTREQALPTPMAVFPGKAPPPTPEARLEGMGGMEKFIAGAGQEIANLIRGGKQALGYEVPQEPGEREFQEALSGTGAGTAGSIAMLSALLAPFGGAAGMM